MKKYEKLIKFIILMLPIIIGIFTACSLDLQTGTIATLYSDYQINIFGSLPQFSLFESFNYTIVGLFEDESYVWFVLNFVEWWLFVEFMFLFKNVMCYIFSLANKWLERGID